MKVFAHTATVLLALTCFTGFVTAQTQPGVSSPYATLDRNAVQYAGPGRESTHDLSSDVQTIGILLPLHGPQAEYGRRLLAAAQRAIDDQQSHTQLPGAPQLRLAARDENERWGQASSDIVELIEDEHALALVTLFNGDIAHQAEQVANKLGVPLLTLASDPTTTAINIPWIFRMTPSDIDQAQTIAAALPENAASILIVSENDHDGRAGKQEMLRASQKIHAGSVRTIEMNRDDAASGNVLDELKQRTPDVVILWIRPESTNRVLALIAEQAPRATSFLSQKSAEFVSTAATLNSRTSTTGQSDGLRLFVPSAKTEEEAGPTGIDLTRGEVAIYRAVRLLAQAIKESGANRARLRDNLANSCRQFDAAGNRVAKWILVPGGKLTSPSPSEAFSSAPPAAWHNRITD